MCVGDAHMHDSYAIRHGDVSWSLMSVLSGLFVLSLFVSACVAKDMEMEDCEVGRRFQIGQRRSVFEEVAHSQSLHEKL